MPLLLEWGEEINFSCVCVAETIIIIIIIIINIILYIVVVVVYQNCELILTSFGCCWYSGGAP